MGATAAHAGSTLWEPREAHEGSAPRELLQRGLQSSRLAWAAPSSSQDAPPPWGPRAPRWPMWAYTAPLRGSPRPRECLLVCAAQVLSECPSLTQTGLPLNTGHHRAGPPQTSSHPPQRPCPLPSPLAPERRLSRGHLLPPRGPTGWLALFRCPLSRVRAQHRLFLHKNTRNHSDLYRENPFISAFCSRFRVSPKCQRGWFSCSCGPSAGWGWAEAGRAAASAWPGVGADPAIPPPSLAPCLPAPRAALPL